MHNQEKNDNFNNTTVGKDEAEIKKKGDKRELGERKIRESKKGIRKTGSFGQEYGWYLFVLIWFGLVL